VCGNAVAGPGWTASGWSCSLAWSPQPPAASAELSGEPEAAHTHTHTHTLKTTSVFLLLLACTFSGCLMETWLYSTSTCVMYNNNNNYYYYYYYYYKKEKILLLLLIIIIIITTKVLNLPSVNIAVWKKRESELNMDTHTHPGPPVCPLSSSPAHYLQHQLCFCMQNVSVHTGNHGQGTSRTNDTWHQ